MTVRTRKGHEVLVHPREQLLRQGCLAVLALLLPLFTVLLWLTAPTSMLPFVLLALAVAMAITVHLIVTYRRARVKASASGIQECGMWGWRPYIPHDEIASIMFVPLYRGLTVDVEDNLFVVGHKGSTLLRMRGRFWTSKDMHSIIDAVGAPATIVSEPQSLEEFRREHSQLLYRHERRALPLLD